MDEAGHELTTFDAPTVSAALATLVFAVVAGVLLPRVPESGQYGGAIDALKNLVYVLTVPFFDIARRMFASRRRALVSAEPAEGPNLLTVAFVSALVLFVGIEAISWLVGFGVGGLCKFIGQSAAEIQFGGCLLSGLNIMSTVVIGPMMLALGFGTGWIWLRLVDGRLLVTVLLFAVALALLFAVDYFVVLLNSAEALESVRQHMTQGGPLRHIGLQELILVPSVLIGYGARRLWSAVAGAIA